MSKSNKTCFDFQALSGKKVQAEFSGGDITSDGGALLLRDIDRQLGLLKDVDQALDDERDIRHISHSQLSLLRQRVYGLCLGYEDINDHKLLKKDTALQTAVNRQENLGSESTLCRLENRANRTTAIQIHKVIVEKFIDSFKTPPKELILDFDATDDPLHGQQEGRFYHGYYDRYCFLPLYVFCGNQLLTSYLRPSNVDGAKHTWAILSLLVKRFRQQWPNVNILFRGDGGFCRHKMFSWCERHNVKYIVGLAKNARLLALIKPELECVAKRFEESKKACREFKDMPYGAGSWRKERRVIAKVEHLSKGANPRFIVTNLDSGARELYENVYCARGEMENRIKEKQGDLFADRTSCHDWWANQFRLLLSSLAYVLMESIRRLALHNTDWAKIQIGTLRLRLLKIGAVVLQNTRRIRLLLSENYPWQERFFMVARRLQGS